VQKLTTKQEGEEEDSYRLSTTTIFEVDNQNYVLEQAREGG
jgi:hypothetical protein